MTQRTIIIGDVHGCKRELKRLLDKVEYDEKNDRLIFVGDLVNKGPDSRGVLKLVKGLNAEVVVGNHELWLLDRDERTRTLKKELGDDLKKWEKYIRKFKPFIEDDDFIVVHAGLIPGEHPKDSDLYDITSIRTWDGKGKDLQSPDNPPWYELYKGKKLVVYGHWSSQGLLERKNTIGLDSACVNGGALSALILPERKIVQAKAKKDYCE